MKVETSELTGAALNHMVHLAEGMTYRYDEKYGPMYFFPAKSEGSVMWNNYPKNYCEAWAQGGPVIAREGITTHGGPAWTAQYSVAVRAHHGGHRGYFRHVGSTPLIAAMRCFVASKLGSEVDIPEELR